MRLLLDTNALSEPLKKHPHERFLRRLAEVEAARFATSAVCLFELRHGCRRRPDGNRLWARIEREVVGRIEVLPFGREEAVRAGDIQADLAARGISIGIEDVMIGATALVHGCEVVTRNVRHLSRIPGLPVLDWWA
jgi:predicted nucleic acid-binding protein